MEKKAKTQATGDAGCWVCPRCPGCAGLAFCMSSLVLAVPNQLGLRGQKWPVREIERERNALIDHRNLQIPQLSFFSWYHVDPVLIPCFQPIGVSRDND